MEPSERRKKSHSRSDRSENHAKRVSSVVRDGIFQWGAEGEPERLDENLTSMSQASRVALFAARHSEVLPGVVVTGDVGARDVDTLSHMGITHVLNCAGDYCDDYGKGIGLEYLTYCMSDGPGQDVLSLLHDCFDFISNAARQGGRTLVHCQMGVSRSGAVAVAWGMWKKGLSFAQAHESVKQHRSVISPHAAFIAQLLTWDAARMDPHPPKIDSPNPTALWRVGAHMRTKGRHRLMVTVPVGGGCAATAGVVRARGGSGPAVVDDDHLQSVLDPRSSFVVVSWAEQDPMLFVWHGMRTEMIRERMCLRRAAQLVRYVPGLKDASTFAVRQTEENGEGWALWVKRGLDKVYDIQEAKEYDGLFGVGGICTERYERKMERILDLSGSMSIRLEESRDGSTDRSIVEEAGVGDDVVYFQGEDSSDEEEETGDGGSPHDDRTTPPRAHIAPVKDQAELWSWPDMEKLHMFDVDDLDEDGIFVLVTNDPSRMGVHVWVGLDVLGIDVECSSNESSRSSSPTPRGNGKSPVTMTPNIIKLDAEGGMMGSVSPYYSSPYGSPDGSPRKVERPWLILPTEEATSPRYDGIAPEHLKKAEEHVRKVAQAFIEKRTLPERTHVWGELEAQECEVFWSYFVN